MGNFGQIHKMKYLTIILVLSLAMFAMADDASEIRELQALVGGVKAGGSLKVGGSVKGKAAASGLVKGKIAAPKVGVKAKVTVPKVAVKAKVTVPKVAVPKVAIKGKVAVPKIGVKIAAKPKVAIKGKVTVPKIGIKIGGAAKPKVAVKGGLKIKTGLNISGGLKLGGKANIKVAAKPAAPKPTGTCPMAVKMGFETTEAYNRTDKSVCKSLKQSCCKAESMKTFGLNFKAWMKQTSKTMWTLCKLPTIAGVVMGNLSAATCPKAKKDDDKKDDKKDEKKDDKKDDKKDEKNDDKKDGKKDEKKATDAKKRILQALKVSGGVKVPKVAIKAKVAVPKVKIGVTVP